MKKILLWAGAFLLAGAAPGAATTIAQYTFESATTNTYYGNSGAGLNTNAPTAQAAEVGTSATFTGHHSDTQNIKQWGYGLGDGAGGAVIGQDWNVGTSDFWEFDFATNTFPQLKLTFDQASSASGPGKWAVEYTTDNWASAAIAVTSLVNPITFATASTYTVLENGKSPNAAWSGTGAVDLAYQIQFQFAAANANGVRLYVFDDTNAGGTTTFNTGSTSRIDNVLIEGVPEPSTWAGMLSGLAAIGIYRRRRR